MVYLEREFPELPDEIVAEAVVLLFLRERKAGAFIDAARRMQNVVGPECEFAITGLPGERNTFVDEPCAHAHSASRRLDQKQTELGNRL